MMFTKALVAATLATLSAALPHTVERRQGGGSGVTIVNNMDTDVYAWSVATGNSKMHTLTSGGGSYSEDFKDPSSGGVSIKLSTHQNKVDVLQFEYTPSGDTIFWDMSCIDMDRASSTFTEHGFAVSPSKTSENCPAVNCHAGDTSCAEAYLKPNDNHATNGCPIDTSFQLTLGA